MQRVVSGIEIKMAGCGYFQKHLNKHHVRWPPDHGSSYDIETALTRLTSRWFDVDLPATGAQSCRRAADFPASTAIRAPFATRSATI
jgi:hypothetical protein